MNFFRKKIAGLSSTKRSVVKNVYWAVLGKIINLTSALFVGILVARYLGPEQYGLMNYIISFVSLFAVFANFGLDNIEVRELAQDHSEKERILGTAFSLKLFFSFVTICLIAVVLYFFESDSFTTWMIMVYSLSIVMGSFSVIRNYFTSIILNEYVVKTEILRTLLGALIKVFLLLLHAPLSWFIIACTFDFFLVAGGYVYSYRRKVDSMSHWRFDKELSFYLIKQSFPLLLSGAAVIIYQRIDQVMIGNMIDKTSVGYFSTACRFSELILFLPGIMAQTVTPLLVHAKERNSLEYTFRRQQFVNVVVWISIVLSVLMSMSSYWLISLTFGKQYLPAVPVLQIMAFKALGMALSSSGGQLIIIEKIQKWAFIRNVIGCVLCVCLNLLLIPSYGIIGSAIVTIITVLFSGFISNLFIPPYHHIFRIQVRALLLGWVDILKVRKVFKE